MRPMTTETSSVVFTLEQSVIKMEVVSLLTLELLNPGFLSLSLRGDAAEALLAHLSVCKTYQSVDMSVPKRHNVQNTLRDFLRVVRTYKINPQREEPVQGTELITDEDHKAVENLTEGLQGLINIVLWVLNTPTEEQENMQYVQEVTNRYMKSLEQIQELEKQVAAEEHKRDQEVGQMDMAISGMRTSLQEMEKDTEDYVRRKQEESMQQKNEDQRRSEEKLSHLQQEVHQLQVQIDDLITEHRAAQSELCQMKNNLEIEITNKIQEYDQKMEEQEADICNVIQVFEQEKTELSELLKRYTPLEEEWRSIMEERRGKRKDGAAVVIQAFWRGWYIRNCFKKEYRRAM